MDSSDTSKKTEEVAAPTNINWFPGHMAKAMRQLKEKMKLVDVIVEVRDARAPLTSGNGQLIQEIGNKRHLIVLNKSNLADPSATRDWQRWFVQSDKEHLFINSFDTKSLKKISQSATRMMASKWQTFTNRGIRHPPLRMMIVGVPNTGKSTIINRLTKRKATKTGDRPGVTRAQEWVLLGKDVELLDTPGIMPPKIDREEQGFWLCAIHAIRDEIVGKEVLARFVLQHMLKHYRSGLEEKYQLPAEVEAVEEALEAIGVRLNFKKQADQTDTSKTCGQILMDLRKGALGPCTFEFPPARELS